MLTEKFATTGTAIFVTGVAYDDSDGDGFYTPGEGLTGVTLRVGAATADTAAAGGYSLAVAPAAETRVDVLRGGVLQTGLTLTMGGQNAKVDLFREADGTWALGLSASARLEEGPLRDLRLLGIADLDLSLAAGLGASALSGNRGDNRLTGGAGDDTLAGGEGNDTLIGGGGNDRLDGGAGNDLLQSWSGQDTLIGGAGSDLFVIGAGARAVIQDFEPGRDRIDLSDWEGLESIAQLTVTALPGGGLRLAYGDGQLDLFGAAGALAASDLTAANMIGLEQGEVPDPDPDEATQGGPGPDLLIGTDGDDIIHGGAGNDTIHGEGGHDTLYGGDGDDRLFGGDGDDHLFGGAGADRLDGGTGANTLNGGLGNDRYVIRSVHDVIEGEIGYSQGGGIDTVESWIDYTLTSNLEILRLQGTEDLRGFGGWAPEALVGNAGNNWLDGGHGNDVLNGKDGDDTLIGGMGADSLVGEAGADVFLFRSVAESRPGQESRDFINGFFREEGDRIDLSQIDANTTRAGDQAFTFIGSRGFSGQAGELRYFTWGGNNFNIVEADVDGDGRGDMQIFVNLTDHMVQSDFIL